MLIELQNLLIRKDKNGFSSMILDNRLVFEKVTKDYRLIFSISAQYADNSTLLLYNGGELLLFQFEELFSSLLIDDLIPYSDPKITLVADSSSCPQSNDLHFKKILDQNDIVRYIESIVIMLTVGSEKLIELVQTQKLFADALGQYSFNERENIIVGGRFPVSIMKKLLIFQLGNDEKGYSEYKSGLESLLRKYEEKKPEKIEEVKMFWTGYKYFIEKLETGYIPQST